MDVTMTAATAVYQIYKCQGGSTEERRLAGAVEKCGVNQATTSRKAILKIMKGFGKFYVESQFG